MIPWLTWQTIPLGPITIQVWGLFVAMGIALAAWLSARRAKNQGLDPKAIWDMAFWMVLWGIIGARLVHVLFYDHAYYLAHPFEAIDLRQPGFAIVGGLLGGAMALAIMVRRRGLDFLAYADTFAWGVPWGCGVGRIGCFLIHDHPGTLTSFVGGVQYPDGVRHDLGLYLSILGFAMGIFFFILGRKKQKTGTYIGAFLIIYGIARFFLDFLRIIDQRWLALTPTQWIMVCFVVMGTWLIWKKRVV